jgi:hypothetical protein
MERYLSDRERPGFLFERRGFFAGRRGFFVRRSTSGGGIEPFEVERPGFFVRRSTSELERSTKNPRRSTSLGRNVL